MTQTTAHTEPSQPPRGDQILADMSLSDSEAFAAAKKAYGDPNEDRPNPDKCGDPDCDC